MSSCIVDGFYSTINIGGFVIFFSFVGEVLNTSNIFEVITIPFLEKYQARYLALGLLEFTNGISGLALDTQNQFSLPLISFLLGFGGLSVTMQSLSFLKNINISPLIYIKSKLYHGLLSFIITFFISKYILNYSETAIKIETYSKDKAIKRYFHNDFIANNIEFHPIITMMMLSFILFVSMLIIYKLHMIKNKKPFL